MEGFALVLAFDNASVDYALGVEVGMVHQRLCSEPLPVSATMHAATAEMALRMAEAHGCPVRAAPLSDEWLAVSFG